MAAWTRSVRGPGAVPESGGVRTFKSVWFGASGLVATRYTKLVPMDGGFRSTGRPRIRLGISLPSHVTFPIQVDLIGVLVIKTLLKVGFHCIKFRAT